MKYFFCFYFKKNGKVVRLGKYGVRYNEMETGLIFHTQHKYIQIN